MDIFDVIAVVWIVSVAVAVGVGYFMGCASDAMTLGVFLGPVGAVAVFVNFLSSNRRRSKDAKLQHSQTAVKTGA